MLAPMRTIRDLPSALRRLDLRFKSFADEKDFTQSSKRYSLRLLAPVACIGFVTQASYIFIVTLPEMAREDSPLKFELQDPRTKCSVALIANMIHLSLIFLVTSLALTTSLYQRINHEYLWMIMSVGFSFNFSLTRTYGAITLAGPGVDRSSIWLHDAVAYDGIFMLGIDMVVTIMCLCAVARVHFLSGGVLCIVSFFVTGLCVFGVADPTTLPATIAIVLVLCFFALIGAWKNENRDRLEWLQNRKIQQQQIDLESNSAMAVGMTAIAERLCDLVIRLGPDLCFCDDEVAHASFFGQPMFGNPIARVFMQSEHERFQEMLQRASESQFPQCMHFTLLAASRPLQVEILAVESISKQHRYIIGIRVETGLDALQVADLVGPPEALNENTIANESFEVLTRQGVATRLESKPESVTSTTLSGRVFNEISNLAGDPGEDTSNELERHLWNFVCMGCKEHWLIGLGEVCLFPEVVLGRGGFGLVVAAQVRGTAMALKFAPPRSREDIDKKYLARSANELQLHRYIRHPNIVAFYGAFIDPCGPGLVLLFELVDGLNLNIFIQRQTPLEEVIKMGVLIDIACGLQYLHRLEPQIVHGDIKPANIMVEGQSARYQAKLIDLGLSTMLTKKAKRMGGTRVWTAPEARKRNSVLAASADVYSFGLIIYFTLVGRPPPVVKQWVTVLYPEGWPRVLAGLPGLHQYCTHEDPKVRPSMNEAHVSMVEDVRDEAAARGLSLSIGFMTVGKGLMWQEARVALQERLKPQGEAHAVSVANLDQPLNKLTL